MTQNLTRSNEFIPPDLIDLRQPMTPEQFELICTEHSELRLELTSTGELIIMPPTGFQSSVRNANLTSQLVVWATNDGSGVCCDSSTIFALPNGARRSPDGAWIKREKLNNLTDEQKESFAQFCPDFVVEVRSQTDRLSQLRNKMVEYVENGVSLGWLIDPFRRQLYVYRPNDEVVVLDNPETVSGDPLLPGFKLDLTEIWESS